MDTDIDDMFAILSFLKICKIYKKLKRKRATDRLKNVSETMSGKTQSRRMKIRTKQNPNPKQPEQETRQFCSVTQQDEQHEESPESAEQEEHYHHIEPPFIEEKPKVLLDNSQETETFADENCQYEISFEVNGEHRQVVLGNVHTGPDTKYECIDSTQICYEVNPEHQDVLYDNVEEIHADQCHENTEIGFELSNTEIEEPPTQSLPPVPIKRRRRRRRGKNAEPEEEPRPVEKKPRTRNFKVRPENLNRNQEGYFGKVFLDIKSHDETQFLLLTRMKRSVFDKLLKLVFKPMSKRVQHIYPEERISITLLHLAHGTPFDVIAKKYKLGKTTVRNIILETCEVLYEVLAPLYMPEPNSEDYLKIANDFKTVCKLPNCVGVVDGKHVTLKKPRRTILEEYNLTSISSLVILAACDAKHLFRSATVTVEAHQSTFGKGIMSNTLPLPPNSPLEADSTTDFPYYFVGDSTFPLRSNVMRPYDGASLNDKEVFYNYRLSQGQAVIENTFSILSSTWKVLLTNFDLSPLNCEAIILGCIVLHNFLIIHGEDRWHNSVGNFSSELPHDVNEHTEWVTVESVQYQPSLQSISKFGSESNAIGHEIRDALTDYFYNDGSIDTHSDLFDI